MSLRGVARVFIFGFLGIAGTIGVAVAYFTWPEHFDTRFNGAYQLDDERLVLVGPRTGDSLRYYLMSGESQALWPDGNLNFIAGPGWNGQEPVQLRVTFTLGPDGKPTGLTWKPINGVEQHGRHLQLPETEFTFRSGNLTLRGKLVLPEGAGPFPAVVFAHGSGSESAVDTYFEPYLFAAYGIAGLVYDKRGTGESEGTYTQNFPLLARDLNAAVDWLRTRSDIDATRMHAAGYSQGGWVAPLAAATSGHIRSLLINYGAMVPVIDEDRWGYVFSLRQHGFGDTEIAKIDEINRSVGAILDRNEDAWDALGDAIDAARGEPWFSALQESDSALGELTSSPFPLWAMRIYVWWLFRTDDGPYIDRLYDPYPTAASLENTPSLWIYGGLDHSLPSEWSMQRLETLRARGLPITVKFYPDADHGMLRVRPGTDGEEEILGYEPGYFAAQVNWVREQSGLPLIPAEPAK